MTSTKALYEKDGRSSFLKVIALDDEPIALEVIKSLAAEVPCIRLSACFTRTKDALAYLQQEQVDLIFLDIKMPGISGIDFLKSLSHPPMVIFTTAYAEHALLSFELEAIDYLLKPFSFPRFLKACNKAFEQYQLRQKALLTGQNFQEKSASSIFLKSGYELIKIELADLLYAESTGNYVRFVLTKEELRSRLTMVELEVLLSAPLFVRVHRSFLVSSAKITRLDKRNVWLDDRPVPVGPMYRFALEKLVFDASKK
ncbi:LytTR family DNA-binding domain-containing protein [Pedobacter gandavensis]|uniref:LytR/AlgR family response regulator transcription factor n=1 Tax=Pedobacter gandavensis TaxID=2679963 RepID=UPI00292E5FB0|nr:LytTR family DNA-binding domain-containing protein [Pedobacter gandavensis]